MFFSKARLVGSEGVGLVICVVYSFLLLSATKKWAHVRLSTGGHPVLICRGSDMRMTHAVCCGNVE